MNKTIEAVARALHAELGRFDDDWEIWEHEAEAVIAAYTQAVASEAVGVGKTAYVRVIVDTEPNTNGWCFCTPIKPEGETDINQQFYGQVFAPPAPQPRVKPLVWEDEQTTTTPFGRYCINETMDDRFCFARSSYPTYDQDDVNYETLEEAKAAAQADYETRILSALESAPAIPAGYKLVPIEPTEAMLKAGVPHTEGDSSLPYSLYRAMLAAAPEAP